MAIAHADSTRHQTRSVCAKSFENSRPAFVIVVFMKNTMIHKEYTKNVDYTYGRQCETSK